MSNVLVFFCRGLATYAAVFSFDLLQASPKMAEIIGFPRDRFATLTNVLVVLTLRVYLFYVSIKVFKECKCGATVRVMTDLTSEASTASTKMQPRIC
jgi:hypothetical protein